MEKSESSNGICQVPTSDLKAEPEKIWSSALLTPVYLVACYVFILRTVYYRTLEVADSDPFQNVWISGPIVATVLYLMMIYFGQKHMANREEFRIKPYIFTYNFYQCVMNILTVGGMLYEVFTNPIFPMGMWGNTAVRGARGFNISFLVWAHYNNKYIELLDTVFMVLRKKNNQVSFLHCYHHILLIWSWYLCVSIETTGDVYFGAMINSFVHIVMYGYYTMALLNIPCPWKKWITKMQLLQFCVCFSHSCFVVWKGNMPVILPLAQAFVMVNMLVLFTQFYNKSYVKPVAKEGETIENKKKN